MTAAPARAIIDAENPWPGLGAFDEDARQYFNGRAREAVELRRLVLNNPLTVLFGASGLGKTSLVQAGLFPLLRKDNVLPVYIRLDVRDQTAPLVDQLTQALKEQIRVRRIDAPPFNSGESLWEYLHREGLELWSEQNHLVTPLFALDQFEELFTLGRENAAAISQFRIDLADLVENRMPGALTATDAGYEAAARLALDSQRYRVLIGFREDFLPAVEGWKRDVPSILRNRLRLLPMSGEQAFDAVHATAPHLADETISREIVRFVAAAQKDDAAAGDEGEMQVEPALLSLLCHGLNEKRKAAGKPAFDEALLQGAGQSIVSDFYRNAVRDLPEQVQRFIERELITERGFRNSCDVDDAREVHAVSEQHLRLLVDRRVLRIEPQRGTERVELTHDLLTRVVREDRDAERARRRVRQQRRRFALLALIGVGLLTLLVTFYSMYRTADRQRLALEQQQAATSLARSSEHKALEEVRLASDKLKTALANATTLAEKEKIQREFAESETRIALSHRYSNASLNALRARDTTAATLFALRAVEVTRKVDGTVLASAEDSLRQATPAEPLPLKRPGHKQPVKRGAFSPDGNRVATLAEDGVRIWDVATSEQLLDMPGCDSMVFSQDWKRMACVSARMGGSTSIWNLETGKVEREFSNQVVTRSRAGRIAHLAFSADGKLLAAEGMNTVSSGTVTLLWHGEEPVEVRGRLVAFSPDSRYLATIDFDKVQMWNAESGTSARALETGAEVSNALFTPDGKSLITTGARADEMKLWDLMGATPPIPLLTGLTGPNRPQLVCLAVSADGRQVGAAFEELMAVWSLPGRSVRLRPIERLPLRDGCRFTSDGRYIIFVHETTEGRSVEAKLSIPPQDEPEATAFSSDGKRKLQSDGAVSIVKEGENQIAAFSSATHALKAAVFSPDRQKLATAEEDGLVRIWDTATGAYLRTLRGHRQAVDRLAYSPDGKLLASGDMQGLVNLWGADSRRLRHNLKGHRARILGIAFSPDGKRVATAGYDRYARIWDTATGDDLTLKSPIHPVRSEAVFGVAFTPDGKQLAVAGALTAALWDAKAPFTKIEDIPEGGGLLDGLVFSPNGERLAAPSSTGLKLWTRASGWLPLPDSAPSSGGQGSAGISMSRDGTRIAGGGTDHAVRIWNAASPKDYTSFYGQAEFVRAVAFSPAEDQLLAAADDWALYRHPLKFDALIAEARSRTKDAKLSNSDCEKYLRERTCPAAPGR